METRAPDAAEANQIQRYAGNGFAGPRACARKMLSLSTRSFNDRFAGAKYSVVNALSYESPGLFFILVTTSRSNSSAAAGVRALGST
jgi:hypothetical protein